MSCYIVKHIKECLFFICIMMLPVYFYASEKSSMMIHSFLCQNIDQEFNFSQINSQQMYENLMQTIIQRQQVCQQSMQIVDQQIAIVYGNIQKLQSTMDEANQAKSRDLMQKYFFEQRRAQAALQQYQKLSKEAKLQEVTQAREQGLYFVDEYGIENFWKQQFDFYSDKVKKSLLHGIYVHNISLQQSQLDGFIDQLHDHLYQQWLLRQKYMQYSQAIDLVSNRLESFTNSSFLEKFEGETSEEFLDDTTEDLSITSAEVSEQDNQRKKMKRYFYNQRKKERQAQYKKEIEIVRSLAMRMGPVRYEVDEQIREAQRKADKDRHVEQMRLYEIQKKKEQALKEEQDRLLRQTQKQVTKNKKAQIALRLQQAAEKVTRENQYLEHEQRYNQLTRILMQEQKSMQLRKLLENYRDIVVNTSEDSKKVEEIKEESFKFLDAFCLFIDDKHFNITTCLQYRIDRNIYNDCIQASDKWLQLVDRANADKIKDQFSRLEMMHVSLQEQLKQIKKEDKSGKRDVLTKIVNNRQEFVEIEKQMNVLQILDVLDGFKKMVKIRKF